MEFCYFDDVFDYLSYSSGKEVEATFIPLSPSPLQSNFPPPPSSTPDGEGHSDIQSDPGEWFKYCRDIDHFLGLDSPILPPETSLSQPSGSPLTVPFCLSPAAMGPFRRQDVLAFWPNDGGTSVQPQSQPRLGSSHLSTAGWTSDHSSPFTASSTSGTLIEATAPSSTLPELIPYQSSPTFPSPLERSSLSPQVAPYEREDEHSRIKSSSGGLGRGTLIPEDMLVEFQVDKTAWVPDPPTLPQPSALPSTTRDCRCDCTGPITDWARHWRRSCSGNPDRWFPCSNGCGKNFTRKDNMKRHISLGVCPLY